MSTHSSDRKINYSLRPSKSIERKMIVEVLKEVCTPSEAAHYKYVGFGASFFTDFKIVHKVLGIDEMDSIEGDDSENNQIRCKFNKPFSCVNIVFGESNEKLTKLKWDKKAIVWLDYDKALTSKMLEDVEFCITNLKPGSFLIVTIRRDFEQDTLEDFEKEFGDDVPAGTKLLDITDPDSSYKISRLMIKNRIDSVLANLYSTEEDAEKIVYQQLFNYGYNDGARMLTFGGIVFKNSQRPVVDGYRFNSYDFVKKGEEYCNLTFPIITNKEYHTLNEFLPFTTKADFLNIEALKFIPTVHRKNYYDVYKFYPSYIEIKDF